MRTAMMMLLLSELVMGCESNGNSAAKPMSHSHIAVLPDEVNWKPGPPGLPPGAKFAVLEGNPSGKGFFTLRVSMPDGYRIPAHFHPGVERVTVLSGTLYLGQGATFDDSAAKALPAGSYTSMPAGMRHYGWVKGDTVLQLSSIGPWGITYVNPADDPRNR